MKRLLLLLPLLLASPVRAQVDPAIHKLCSNVKDYAGCVNTQMSLGSSREKDTNTAVKKDSKELTPWKKHLNENPNLKAWVDKNPALGEKKRKEWEAKNVQEKDFYSDWKPGTPRPCKPGANCSRTGVRSSRSIDDDWRECPPGGYHPGGFPPGGYPSGGYPIGGYPLAGYPLGRGYPPRGPTRHHRTVKPWNNQKYSTSSPATKS